MKEKIDCDALRNELNKKLAYIGRKAKKSISAMKNNKKSDALEFLPTTKRKKKHFGIF